MPAINLANLSRFFDKVKDYVASKVGYIGASKPEMIYTATSTDGVTYTATIPGITELYAGLKIYVKFSRASASTGPKLNLNNLGEKGIRQPLSTNGNSFATGPTNTWLNASCPMVLTYTGTIWKTDFVRPSATYLYGKVPVTSGGTGADNADEALTNLGAVSRAEFESEIARLEGLINNN